MRGNGTAEAVNTTGTTTVVNSFLCPSSPGTVGTWYNRPWPGNTYWASTGSSVMWKGGQSSNPNGPFANGGPANGVRDMTDGTSNTVAFGEQRNGDYDDGKNSIQDIVGTQSYSNMPGCNSRDMICIGANMPSGGAGLVTTLTACAASWNSRSGNFGTNGQRSWNGRLWAEGIYGHALGNTLVPPNSPYPYCQFWSDNSDYDSGGINGLTSFHSGGANVCMGDGSVHFIKSAINWNTLWSLGSMSGNDVVSADSW